MSAVIEQVEILTDEWIGCYSGGWKGAIVDGAFAHPAKVAFRLAERIYEHAISEGWIVSGDTVVDCFGGIGGCVFHGLINGMIAVTNELEEKFVNLSKENRELWQQKFTGLPGFNADNWIILQGDSRKLSAVIREAGLSVSSPPYSGSEVASACHSQNPDGRQATYKRAHGFNGYDAESEGQLGAMREGDLTLAVSSPPYVESLKPETEDQTRRKQERIAKSKTLYDGRKMEEPSAGKAGLGGGYGSTEGNIAAMPEGQLCISSPPYAVVSPEKSSRSVDYAKQYETYLSQGGGASFEKFVATQELHSHGYGSSDGQLARMPEGDLCVSSPPFPQPYTSGGGINVKGYGDGSDKVGDRTYQSKGGDRAEGNLETLKDGGFDAAISSPPYNPPMSQDHNGSRGGKRGTEPSETGAFVKYGNSDGQIEGLSMEGFEMAVSSPPWESVEGANVGKKHKDPAAVAKKRSAEYASGKLKGHQASEAAILAQFERENEYTYGTSEGQLGIERGDTFWSASRTILEQLYSVLTPGAHAIFIVKMFVRNKQIVDFPGQWAQLCEAVGFKLIHDHHAMLTEHSGTQGGMFGEDKEIKVKRVSFFRRLHEKRAPETEIYYENVLCFERT